MAGGSQRVVPSGSASPSFAIMLRVLPRTRQSVTEESLFPSCIDPRPLHTNGQKLLTLSYHLQLTTKSPLSYLKQAICRDGNGTDKGIRRTSLVAQWLYSALPSEGGPGSIPGQGARVHTPQLETPRATTKARRSQTNKERFV